MKHFLFAASLVAGLLFNIHWVHSPWLGIPALALLCYLSATQLATILPPSIKPYRFFWAIACFLTSYTLIGTMSYYAVGITPISSSILVAGLLLPFSKRSTTKIDVQEQGLPNRFADGLFLGAISILAILFWMVFSTRTGDLLISPWQVLEPSFFILYTLGIAMMLWHNSISVSFLRSRVLTSGYLFFAYSIAAIVFAHGFGFDGFIHRATETWIAEHGVISPKTPYYIGQYSVVVLLHHLTGLSIGNIDIFFVPLLAALMLPSISGYMAKAANIPERYGISMAFLLPFLYYITLNLTTPHNLVLLFFALTIFCLYSYAKEALPWWVGVLFATAALLTHPLLGAPLWVFTAYVLVMQHTHSKARRTAYHISFISMSALLPSIMFSANNYVSGFGLPELSNPFQNIQKIISLFARPYWFEQTPYPLIELLYQYQLLITPLFFLLVLLGWWAVRNEKTLLPFIFGTLSFLIAGVCLRAWLYFPNVADAEQNNYPLRLFWASVLFVMPLAYIGLYRTIRYIKKKGLLPFTLFPIAVMLMFSLYFSYPQRNQKVHYPGYNVSDADVITAQWIHEYQGDDDNYVVLANSLTSIAALTDYSFYKHYQTEQGELFYYAIPTGGPLYRLYQTMLYEGQSRDTMNAAMNLTGASTSYFAVSYFWKNHDEIIEGAKKSADEWHSLADGRMHVFIYRRDTTE